MSDELFIPVQPFAAFEVPDLELLNLNLDAYQHLLHLRQDCSLHPLLYRCPNPLPELALKKIFTTRLHCKHSELYKAKFFKKGIYQIFFLMKSDSGRSIKTFWRLIHMRKFN